MRFLLVVAAGIIWFVAGASDAPGQKKDKDKPPEKKTTITEIGGKDFEQWKKEITSKDRSKGENAIRTILMFGPDKAYDAVPILIAELNRRDVILDVSIRVNAVIALGVILGGANEPDKERVDKAVTVLIRFLTDNQAIVRYRAAEALGRIGRASKPAILKLIAATKDTATWEIRNAATVALGMIGVPSTEVLEALELRLKKMPDGTPKDPASLVRISAVQSLTFLGGPANAAQRAKLIGYLKNATKDKEPAVEIWAHMAIMSVNQKIEGEHLQAIAAMIEKKDLAAKIQAAQSLGTLWQSPKAKMGHKEAKLVLPHLKEGLRDKEPSVKFWCMWCLTCMKKDAQPAIKILQAIVDDPNQPDETAEAVKKTAQHTIDIILGKEKGKEKEKGKDKAPAK